MAVPANLSIRQVIAGFPLHDSASSPSFRPSCCWRKGLSYSCTPLRNESLSRSTLGAVLCGLDTEPITPTMMFPRPRLRSSFQLMRQIKTARRLHHEGFSKTPAERTIPRANRISHRCCTSPMLVFHTPAWIVTYSSEELDVCRYEASWGL